METFPCKSALNCSIITESKMKKQRLFIITITTSIAMLFSLFMNTGLVSAAKSMQTAPNPPSTGAYTSGVYRNMFAEHGYSAAAIQAKLDAAWNTLFYGTNGTGNRYDGTRIYYPDGSNANGNKAYIEDIGDADVRSEGMSYGMMIAVQLNHKAEFDALWNWVKTNMQHSSGDYLDYTCWHNNINGACIDQGPATDGEEWFTIALYMASGRWGNGTGIYNYKAEADNIADAMLHHANVNGVTPMFDATQNEPVFVPSGSAATFSDPSYHLPAFYALFSLWGPSADAARWNAIRDKSRTYFGTSSNSTTGLTPDYANFDGSPHGTDDHKDYRFDAWRTASNWAVDYSWFAANANEKIYSDRIQSFFQTQGLGTYANQWSITGTALSTGHSAGHAAMNAATSLAATNVRAWLFIDELWNLPIPSGQWRYYDGLLYYLSLLELSGNFRIYAPGGGSPTSTPTITPTKTNTPTPTRTNTPVPSGNFLTNANMESGTTGWVVNGAGTLSSDTTQFHGGTKSIKITGRTASWNGPAQNVAASNFTNGGNRTVSVWVRSQTGMPTAKATVRLTAGTTTYVTLASAAVNSTGWTLLTGTVPVSWSGTLTGVLFYVETAAGTDNLYIDDASLQ
jgi:endo-1,4-beta-D-glucanase Y